MVALGKGTRQWEGMQHRYVFGYGSLVNRATLDRPDDAHPAELHGWARCWRHIASRQVAILTAVQKKDAVIAGLVVGVAEADWGKLERREEAYDRASVSTVTHALETDTATSVFHIPADKHPLASAPRPILLSYLDVVVQGYFRVFGESGVAAFFETTEGWDAPILNDRADPIYPRHQLLTSKETALVDHHVARLPAQVQKRM